MQPRTFRGTINRRPATIDARLVEAREPRESMMDIPKQYREYACSDYFSEGWSERGHFDEESQTLVIAPLTETYEVKEVGFLAVGRSGWDGIDFGYRVGFTGLWAYYPIEREFKFISSTVAELVEDWCSGKLSV